jgi:hypothetical protein
MVFRRVSGSPSSTAGVTHDPNGQSGGHDAMPGGHAGWSMTRCHTSLAGGRGQDAVPDGGRFGRAGVIFGDGKLNRSIERPSDPCGRPEAGPDLVDMLRELGIVFRAESG